MRRNSAPRAAGHSLIAQVEAYWSEQRKGALVPTRADINPRGIEAALPSAFILERVAPGIARFRLAGGNLCDLMGMDVRGMPITAMMDVDARVKLVTPLEAVFKKPAIARFSLLSPRGISRPALDATMALFPLTDGNGNVTRALGCFVSNSRAGRTPRRFAIEDMQVDAIGAPRPKVYTNGSHLRLVSSRD
ncbi:PAS domain-containing protein [Cognatishimia sp. MH4019]|uniref:PAS domain-containing protein n=1 Tax=Cognatishimia sp. MH4019 TaxID=2854030 RepID=UPI001CD78110|nr:PAS domain-containing protein [Cognatishimia sp. MH4019]